MIGFLVRLCYLRTDFESNEKSRGVRSGGKPLEIDFLNSGKQKTLGRVMTKRFKTSLSLGVFFTNIKKISNL